MSGEGIEVEIESLRAMGQAVAARPMRELEGMGSAITRVDLSAGAYGAFGILGGSIGQALDEVKAAALQYLAAKREEVSQIHVKAYQTANGYVAGNQEAARLAADIPKDPHA